MLFGSLVLITALTISGVAIYYSVSGLVAIFAAAAIPIIIMGSALEVGKLVAAAWLHKYWDRAAWWLRLYLSVATLILMFITSMGIFGFLSKAHIDQTASAGESIARIERIDLEIAKQQRIVDSAESEIAELETAGKNNDQELQTQIDKEQERIDSAYERIQPAIDEQNEIIDKEEQRLTGSLSIYEDQLVTVNSNLQKIEDYIASDSIKELQALVGVEADGSIGPATRSAIENYRVTQAQEKQRLAELIAAERSKLTSPVIDAARAEIQRLRTTAEEQIAQSNDLINRLREQLGTEDKTTTEANIAAEQATIQQAESEITVLSEEKYRLEAEYRKLEAEVGPVKYLAEFIYGETSNKSLLEDAVRWVIIIIIFVFDPLAVILLIASQYTFRWAKEDKVNKQPVDIVKSQITDSVTVKPKKPTKPKKEKVITVKDNLPKTILVDTQLEEMLEKADPETIEEVFNELKKETVDNETEESYIDVNDTVKDKVYGIDGKLVQSTKQIKSIKIKSKDE
jgi:hypothetical protein